MLSFMLIVWRMMGLWKVQTLVQEVTTDQKRELHMASRKRSPAAASLMLLTLPEVMGVHCHRHQIP